MRILATLLLLAGATLAQTIESVTPECAAPGDLVLVRGADFGENPTVTVGDLEAEVLKGHETKLVVRVPSGAVEGQTTIGVDGTTTSFFVLADGAPIVRHVSAATATPGQVLVVVGARLKGALAVFVDGDDNDVASAELRGGGRVGWFKVPGDLAAGAYTLELRNDAGDSGPCSPAVEIVAPGDPTIDSIAPEAQQPGGGVTVEGTDLGPIGFCRVTWTAGDATLRSPGFANGFDKVWTHVPPAAEPGATYDVTIEFGDASETPVAFPYEVGATPDPFISELEFDEGPAGSVLGIFGEGLLASRGGGRFVPLGNAAGPIREEDLPKVEFTRGDVATEADILFGQPGFGFRDDVLVVEVPPALADGDYDVTVTVGGKTSNAVVFTVKDLPLAVTSMKPDEQESGGKIRPVLIEGTGFGIFSDNSLAVTWDDGDGEPAEGFVLFHTDRQILVIPPGGWFDPLPVGTYTVRVVKSPQNATPESVVAGTYTVH